VQCPWRQKVATKKALAQRLEGLTSGWWRATVLEGRALVAPTKMARRPAWAAPTKLARRPAWEVWPADLHCRGDLRGLTADGPAQRRPFRRKEAF
jgi:hypothetical protein